MPTLPLEQMTVKEKLQAMGKSFGVIFVVSKTGLWFLNGRKTYWTDEKS